MTVLRPTCLEYKLLRGTSASPRDAWLRQWRSVGRGLTLLEASIGIPPRDEEADGGHQGLNQASFAGVGTPAASPRKAQVAPASVEMATPKEVDAYQVDPDA